MSTLPLPEGARMMVGRAGLALGLVDAMDRECDCAGCRARARRAVDLSRAFVGWVWGGLNGEGESDTEARIARLVDALEACAKALPPEADDFVPPPGWRPGDPLPRPGDPPPGRPESNGKGGGGSFRRSF